MPVTRSDVAKRAGVSAAVVSYVLNDGPRPVSSAARARVLEAIEALGYRRDAVARSLRLGRTHSLGLIVPDVGLPYFGQMTQAVSAHATARGLQLLVAHSDYDLALERSQLTSLAARRVDGVVLMSVDPLQDLDWVRRTGVPTVVVDRPDFAVSTAEQATAHLVGHGSERVNLVTGYVAFPVSRRRREGWSRALSAAGLPADDADVVATMPSPKEGERAVDELVSRGRLGSAVVVDSDVLAMGVLRRLHELGRSVPDDVRVASLDATELAPHTIPSLTSVRQPTEDIARAAVSACLADALDVVRWVDDAHFEMVLRESCGCVLVHQGTSSL